MKKVRFLDEPKEPKPIEFTHFLHETRGWTTAKMKPTEFQEIIYLGKCKSDGDMFCAKYKLGIIEIYKGHLNDGVY